MIILGMINVMNINLTESWLNKTIKSKLDLDQYVTFCADIVKIKQGRLAV